MHPEQNELDSDMHVAASDCFVTEVKVPHMPTQLGPCCSVSDTLLPPHEGKLSLHLSNTLFLALSLSLQEMFAFLNKKNLRQYIYKVNYLLHYT